MTFVGIALGITVSVKWVGLFTIAMIGLSTIGQLWVIVTDSSIPLRQFYRHFMARVATLILVPVLIYMFFFQVHFAILNKMGPGAGFMSPGFQSKLAGSKIMDSYRDVAYGSSVILRHQGSRGGYLHSHLHDYPAGSKQQQITCYPHRDENSYFIIKKDLKFENDTVTENPISGFEVIKNGMVIRLEHRFTKRRLHSHDVRPGFTDDKEINEVSAYGSTEVLGDVNDYWIVQIENGKHDQPLHAMTQFRLKHQTTGCFLMSRNSKLPEWAFGQQEVTCSSRGRRALTM